MKKETCRAFLFSHFNSRGGSMLIEASCLAEACKKYGAIWEILPEGKQEIEPNGWSMYENQLHNIVDEDFIHAVTAVFYGDSPEPHKDLDAGYRGDDGGWSYGWKVLISQYDSTNRIRTKELIFWKGQPPDLAPFEEYFKVEIEETSLGEDAFGLLWYPDKTRIIGEVHGS